MQASKDENYRNQILSPADFHYRADFKLINSW